MSFAMKYNRGRKFNVDTTGYEYKSMAELFTADGSGIVYPLSAIFISTKGKFDDYPIFATDKFFVNGPSHMCEVVNEILIDPDAIESINNGEVGFIIYPYTAEKYKKETYGIRFVDMKL